MILCNAVLIRTTGVLGRRIVNGMKQFCKSKPRKPLSGARRVMKCLLGLIWHRSLKEITDARHVKLIICWAKLWRKIADLRTVWFDELIKLAVSKCCWQGKIMSDSLVFYLKKARVAHIIYDDAMAWPFERGIHQWTNGQVAGNLTSL